MGLFDSQRCCCVVPFSAGVYLVLIEQALAGGAVVAVALVPPDVLAASIPSFGSYLLAGLAGLHILIQLFGFIAVKTHSVGTIKTYSICNFITLALVLAASLAFIIISAIKRDEAATECLSQFGQENTPDASGRKLCELFVAIQLGVMGLLWVIAIVSQAYFAMMVRIYAHNLNRDQIADANEKYYRASAAQSSIWGDTTPSNFNTTFKTLQRSDSKSTDKLPLNEHNTLENSYDHDPYSRQNPDPYLYHHQPAHPEPNVGMAYGDPYQQQQHHQASAPIPAEAYYYTTDSVNRYYNTTSTYPYNAYEHNAHGYYTHETRR